MNLFPTKNKKIDPVADAKLRALTEEVEIKTLAFEAEARMRMKRLESDIEDAKHGINVAKHEMKETIVKGINKMNDAAKAIMLPEDMEQ